MPPFRRGLKVHKSFKYRGPARGSVKARAVPLNNSLQRQVKSLLEGKRRDSPSVSYNLVMTSPTTATAAVIASGCPTSTYGMTATTGFAPEGTGLIPCNADTALINSIRLKGSAHYLVNGLVAAQIDGIEPVRLRALLVWFNKPALQPDNAGTLPPLSEVLESNQVDGLEHVSSANSGRFTILSDRVFNIGKVANSAAGLVIDATLPLMHSFDYTIKVNKKQHYVSTAISGAAGGTYDIDVDEGLVDKGLPVLYLIMDPGKGTAATEVVTVHYRAQMRLNFTA